MKLIVLGATGGTGLEIVRQAVEHGHAVTAFVRSPERLKPFWNRITVKQGDLTRLRSPDHTQGMEYESVPDHLIWLWGRHNPFLFLLTGPMNSS